MDSRKIRYKNARALVKQVGGVSLFADRLGKQQSQVSSFAGENPVKGIGGKIARQIEAAFRKPEGWMDVPHHDLWDGVASIGHSDKHGERGQWGDAADDVSMVAEEPPPPYSSTESMDLVAMPVTQHGKRVLRAILEAENDGLLSQDLALHLIATINLYRKH